MSDTIVLRHPTLPAEQEIEVRRDAMPHYTAAGWQLVPQDELDKRAALAAAAAAAAAAEQADQEPQAQDEAEQLSVDTDTDTAAADTSGTDESAEPKKRPARRAKAPQEEES
ncbi:hypothetical protein [Streptomyces sp. NPDC051452]|uniref:hypothetical protein n=1 Tax=Streptomyces sp. NPDC051452 TaxID=3365654 RepID=UPI0037B940EE